MGTCHIKSIMELLGSLTSDMSLLDGTSEIDLIGVRRARRIGRHTYAWTEKLGVAD